MSLKSRDFAHGASFIMGARDMGITILEGILELIDNSLDAEADNIRVHIENNGDHIRIFVEDDGHGIKQSITKGDTEYDGITYALAFGDRYEQGGIQIGKFGWGLPASATCNTLRTEVYTHQRDEDGWRYSYVDIEEMDSKNDTRPPVSTSNSPDHFDLEFADEGSGTIISFESCDDPEPKTVTGIYRKLIRQVPQTYRYYLEGSKNIKITAEKNNGEYLEENLKARDPLFMMEDAHNVGNLPKKIPKVNTPVLDESVFIEDKDGEEHPVRVRIVMLDVESIRSCDEWNRSWMKNHGLIERNQGFSLVRDGREIRSNLTLGLFTTHSDKNYMRAEIRFPPELDYKFGIQTNKNRLSPRQSVKSKIDEAIGNAPHQIQRETREKISELAREAQEEEEEDATPTPSEAAAETAAKFLGTTKEQTDEEAEEIEKEIEDKKQNKIEDIKNDEDIDEEEQEEKIEKTKKKYERQKQNTSYNVTSETFNGSFYKPEFRGKQVNTVINEDTEFYDEYDKLRNGLYGSEVTATDGGMQEVGSQQTEASILIDHLLLSASRAELRMQDRHDYNDDVKEYMIQFRNEWSEALRVFLKYMDEGKDEAISKL